MPVVVVLVLLLILWFVFLFQHNCLFKAAWQLIWIEESLLSFSLAYSTALQRLTAPSFSTVAQINPWLACQICQILHSFFLTALPPNTHPLSVSCPAAVIAASKANVFIETKGVCHRVRYTHPHARACMQCSQNLAWPTANWQSPLHRPQQGLKPSIRRCGPATRRGGRTGTEGKK